MQLDLQFGKKNFQNNFNPVGKNESIKSWLLVLEIMDMKV